ncbi:MAG: patatin-like phospholipase family protein [Campylobacterota bacterium]|nr:patatin-like phospholipase family protein [Campylobacterota bacterium]
MIKKIIFIILIIVNCDSDIIKEENNLKNKNHKTVSLALGSGGARGYAHIGAIEEIEKKGYKIESIAGSSMGALIGGLYAVGKLDEYKKWILTLGYYDVYKLIKLSSTSGALIDADEVFNKIALMIGDVNIEELPLKYRAVATDIITQKEVVFTEGKLIDAIRASIAIPTVFTSVVKGKMILVDGGVLNPLPINAIIDDNTDLKIVVNLDANVENKYIVKIPLEHKTREEQIYNEFNSYIKKAESYVPNKLLDIVDKNSSKVLQKITQKEKKDIFFILGRTIDTAQGTLAKYSMQNHKADIVIEIPRSSCEFYEFTKAYKMIEIGKMATKEKI